MKLNKKIGIISFDFDPPLGGQGTYVKDLVRELKLNELDYTVFSSSDSKKINHVKISRIQKKDFGPLFFSLYGNLLINKWIDKYNLGLVHIQTGAGGFFLLRKVKVPVITTSHNLYSEKIKFQSKKYLPLLKKLEEITFQNSNLIISTSEKMKADILQNYNIEEKKVKTIYLGVNTRDFYPKIIKKDKRLLFVGRLERTKGIIELLNAFVNLAKDQKGLFLDIIGTGSLYSEIQSFINKRNLKDKVKLLGFKGKNELNYYYNRALLTILPSKYESFGLVACESLASGTPAIVPANSGIAPLFDRLKCWSSVDASEDNLKNKIEDFLKSPNRKNNYRRVALKYFDLNQNYKKLIGIYDSFLKS